LQTQQIDNANLLGEITYNHKKITPFIYMNTLSNSYDSVDTNH